MADVLKLMTYLAVAVVLVYSRSYIQLRGLFSGEFFVLVLFAMLGMMVMISASHFLTLYLGLELLSLSLYAHGGAAARFGAGDRGGDEVFRAGRAGLRHAALRHVDDLRRHRHLELSKVAAAIQQTCTATRTVLVFGLVFIVAGLASSSARCRSTCGCPTSTRARPPR